MRRKEPNSKVNVISFRINDEEKQMLMEMAEKTGDSISNLLRRKLNLPPTDQRQPQRSMKSPSLHVFSPQHAGNM